MITTYRGDPVDTELTVRDEDVTLVCLNDACPGVEVDIDDPDEGPYEVRRIAWDSRPVRASGPSYGCGGEPGYDRYPECPVCGESGESL